MERVQRAEAFCTLSSIKTFLQFRKKEKTWGKAIE